MAPSSGQPIVVQQWPAWLSARLPMRLPEGPRANQESSWHNSPPQPTPVRARVVQD
ncbi:MAG: hypothetical protein ACRDV3_12810 [Acidothermaceae bacterium]